MQGEQCLIFDRYRLDLANEQIWQGTQLLPLTSKAFAVLRYLVEHAGQLVTKAELFDTLWPRTAVSDGALTFCIVELRKALGDDAKAPRFIETVHGRGYRFLPAVTAAPRASLESRVQRLESERQGEAGLGQTLDLRRQTLDVPLVGRETDLTQLHQWLEKALGGERQTVFITGEPGIGKTTLVRAFLKQVGARGVAAIGRGQCVENYGPGEAYLPVLDALGRLCRAPGGKVLVDGLRQHAPTWLMQLPAFLSVAEAQALQQKLQGSTQTRMLQEMLATVETLTPQRPLVLLIEDLHWSDYSTLDLIASLAHGHEYARLLIIGTYRPGHMLSSSHPLSKVIRELYAHHLASELALGFLREPHVTDYLQQRFPGNTFAPTLAQALQQRTEGNPLFLTNVLDDWVSREVLTQDGDSWTLQPHLEAVVSAIPETIRHLITIQSEHLLPEEQQVLEVASLAGMKFSSGAIAAALQIDIMEAEEWCAGLAKRQQFLRPAGVSQWPDGTTAERYGFLHALHQQFWHERVHLGRRHQWHLRIGENQEAAYGDYALEVASELAVHFEEGRDFRRAVYYHTQAAGNAAQRYAPQEAVAHLTKGLELLNHQPDTPERMQQELALRTTLGISLQTLRGYGNPVVEQAYTRTRELCQQVREPAQLFRALFGLWQLHHVRAEFTASSALEEQLLSLAVSTNDADLFIEAHGAMGVGSFQRGEFAVARTHLELAVSRYEPERHRAHTLTYGQNPWVASQGYLAETLWFQGYPDQALRSATMALAATPDLAHPFTQAFALTQLLYIYKYHRNVAEVRNHTDTLHAVVRTHGFPFWEPVVEINAGWALSEQGQMLEGIERIRQSIAIRQRLGTTLREPYYNAVLAEIYGKTGQLAEGIQLLDEALVIANDSHERNWEAEIYRLKGELTLAQSSVQSLESGVQENQKSKSKRQKAKVTDPRPLTPDLQGEAEACFLKAIEVSRHQQAKSLELRATMSLVRLWRQQGKQHEAHKMLSEIYGWFTEGFDTKDLQEAQALLAALRH